MVYGQTDTAHPRSVATVFQAPNAQGHGATGRDGLDVVAVSSPVCSASDARRVVARAKAQGAVLFVLGDPGGFSIDVSFSARTEQWQFDTHAHSRTVNVSASGRRVHAHRSCSIQFPIGSCS